MGGRVRFCRPELKAQAGSKGNMRTFRHAVIIFLIFFIGTIALIHADRQCSVTAGESGAIEESVEDLLLKY